MGRFTSLRNRLTVQALFAVFISLCILAILVPELCKATATGTMAGPIPDSMHPSSSDYAPTAVPSSLSADLCEAKADSDIAHTVSAEDAVALSKAYGFIASPNTFSHLVNDFGSILGNFHLACLLLDTPPPSDKVS